jgi:hypothetical protein
MGNVVHRARHGLICHEEQDETIGASLRVYGEWAEEEIYFLSAFIDVGAAVLDCDALEIEKGTNRLPKNDESDTIRIGSGQSRAFIAGIFGATTGGAAIQVLIDANGQLGTISSSCRFKKEIKPMDTASEAILALKPVTFRYKSDKTGTPQFGLIAEEVAEVNPDLVVCDKNGDIYTVRYDQVNAMLLNEFLKEHRKVQELEATVAQQHRDFEAAVAELKGQIQKVSAQLEASKPAPQVVNN